MKQIIVTTHEELRELFHESIQRFKEGLEAEPGRSRRAPPRNYTPLPKRFTNG